jgi:hypothetical protein
LIIFAVANKNNKPIKTEKEMSNDIQIDCEMKSLLLNMKSRMPLGLCKAVYVGPNKDVNKEHYEEMDIEDACNEIDGWLDADGTFIENQLVLSVVLLKGNVELFIRQPNNMSWESLSTQDKQNILRVARETVNKINHPEDFELPF